MTENEAQTRARHIDADLARAGWSGPRRGPLEELRLKIKEPGSEYGDLGIADYVLRDTGNTLYILDESTTGLHFHDVQHLLEVLHRLRDHGNSVVVIERNLDVIKTADWIVALRRSGVAHTTETPGYAQSDELNLHWLARKRTSRGYNPRPACSSRLFNSLKAPAWRGSGYPASVPWRG